MTKIFRCQLQSFVLQSYLMHQSERAEEDLRVIRTLMERATIYRAISAPTALAAYEPHFDVLMTAFGEDRLIWGSNWPVSDLGGSFSGEIRLAEEYLAPFGQVVRDKVMFRNALLFYRRHVEGNED